jgi:FkbM family methyltransferase
MGAVDTVVVETPFGTYRCFDDQFADDLRRFGAHQRSDLALMLDLVEAGDTVIDVGAFIGTVTVPLARKVGPGGRVVSFEPVPEHFALLVENIEQNGVADQVTPVHALVGRESGTGGFTKASWEMSTATTTFRPAGGTEGAEQLATWRVDDWMEANAGDRRPVRLLKVDVEGMELAVLEGAAGVIDADRPIIEVEVGGGRRSRIAETAAFLRARRYRVLVNVAARDAPTDVYRLGPLADLRLLGDMLSDVLAVPEERSLPVARTAGWVETQWVVLSNRTGLRRLAARVRRRLSRGA